MITDTTNDVDLLIDDYLVSLRDRDDLIVTLTHDRDVLGAHLDDAAADAGSAAVERDELSHAAAVLADENAQLHDEVDTLRRRLHAADNVIDTAQQHLIRITRVSPAAAAADLTADELRLRSDKTLSAQLGVVSGDMLGLRALVVQYRRRGIDAVVAMEVRARRVLCADRHTQRCGMWIDAESEARRAVHAAERIERDDLTQDIYRSEIQRCDDMLTDVGAEKNEVQRQLRSSLQREAHINRVAEHLAQMMHVINGHVIRPLKHAVTTSSASGAQAASLRVDNSAMAAQLLAVTKERDEAAVALSAARADRRRLAATVKSLEDTATAEAQDGSAAAESLRQSLCAAQRRDTAARQQLRAKQDDIDAAAVTHSRLEVALKRVTSERDALATQQKSLRRTVAKGEVSAAEQTSAMAAVLAELQHVTTGTEAAQRAAVELQEQHDDDAAQVARMAAENEGLRVAVATAEDDRAEQLQLLAAAESSGHAALARVERMRVAEADRHDRHVEELAERREREATAVRQNDLALHSELDTLRCELDTKARQRDAAAAKSRDAASASVDVLRIARAEGVEALRRCDDLREDNEQLTEACAMFLKQVKQLRETVHELSL
jgi:hypothetical protein